MSTINRFKPENPRPCIFSGLPSNKKLDTGAGLHSWVGRVPSCSFYIQSRKSEYQAKEKEAIELFWGIELALLSGDQAQAEGLCAKLESIWKAIGTEAQMLAAEEQAAENELFEKKMERAIEDSANSLFEKMNGNL